jgi:hypothetical protein
MRTTTGSVPGVSAARRANPSIAELGNGGRSTRAAPARRARARGARRAARSRRERRRPRRARRERVLDREQVGHGASYASRRDLGRRPGHDEERASAAARGARARRSTRSASWEVVFVDDGSTDGTFAALTRLHASATNVRVVRLRRNFGKAAALAAGFAQAAGDVVVTIDGDLQDDPAEIPRLLAKLDEGFDLVSGWKTKRRDPLTRRLRRRSSTASTGRVSGCGCTT